MIQKVSTYFLGYFYKCRFRNKSYHGYFWVPFEGYWAIFYSIIRSHWPLLALTFDVNLSEMNLKIIGTGRRLTLRELLVAKIRTSFTSRTCLFPRLKPLQHSEEQSDHSDQGENLIPDPGTMLSETKAADVFGQFGRLSQN